MGDIAHDLASRSAGPALSVLGVSRTPPASDTETGVWRSIADAWDEDLAPALMGLLGRARIQR